MAAGSLQIAIRVLFSTIVLLAIGNTSLLAQGDLEGILKELESQKKRKPTQKTIQQAALQQLEKLINLPLTEIAVFSDINQRLSDSYLLLKDYQSIKKRTELDIITQITDAATVTQITTFLDQDVPCIPLAVDSNGTLYYPCSVEDHLIFISADTSRIPVDQQFQKLIGTTFWAEYLKDMNIEATLSVHQVLTGTADDLQSVITILQKTHSVYKSVEETNVLGLSAVSVINVVTGSLAGSAIKLFIGQLVKLTESLNELHGALMASQRATKKLAAQIKSIKENSRISVADLNECTQSIEKLDTQFEAFLSTAGKQRDSLRELSIKIKSVSDSTGLGFIESGSWLLDELDVYLANSITSVAAYREPLEKLHHTLVELPVQIEAKNRGYLLSIVDTRQERTQALVNALASVSVVIKSKGFPKCRGELSGALRSLSSVQTKLSTCRNDNIDACFRALSERESVLRTLKPTLFSDYAHCSLKSVKLAENYKADYRRNLNTIVHDSDVFLTPDNILRYERALDSILEKPDRHRSELLPVIAVITLVLLSLFLLRKKFQ